ncbi:hypothetical protein PsorP6_007670 [Peronosclerospora sorghi]|uniref:Uncharacterized protein n=1 Tax=Peronosclerospora sorghi TaxID=230839 RepID=A0ACC0WA60_9STRA|nr:hypothetical protein PsorP6_007670 [Peronosclerospora sorghi]
MKESFVIASCLVAVSMTVAGARQLHDEIDYERYLAEIDDIDVEMKRWKAMYWSDNVWLPDFPEDLSPEEIDEDLRQRIFLSMQDVQEAQAANPNANFSIMTPLSALTKKEFALRIRNVMITQVIPSNPTPTPKKRRQFNAITIVAAPNLTPFNAITVLAAPNPPPLNAITVVAAPPTSIHPFDSDSSITPVRETESRFLASTGDSTITAPINQNPVPITPDMIAQTVVAAPLPPREDTTTTTPTPPSYSPVLRAITVLAAPSPNPHIGKIRPTTPVSGATTPHDSGDESTTNVTAQNIPVQGESRFLRAQSRASAYSMEQGGTTIDSVDWSTSRCMSSVQIQGLCSSCWAFASVAAVESLQCIRSDERRIQKYSVQQVVECDMRSMGCDGGSALHAFEYIQQNGLCSAKSYPYTSLNGESESCSATCSTKETGITGYNRLSKGNEAELIEALQSQPVVAAVAAGNAAWKQYTGGVLSTCGTSAVDHTVLIVGYDDTSFKVRNWWSEDWGEAGHIRLERTSSRSGTCGLLKDMSHPTM